jgi:hypothetical protein
MLIAFYAPERNGYGAWRLTQASGVAWRARLKSSSIAWLKAGMSSGLREETILPSITAY